MVVTTISTGGSDRLGESSTFFQEGPSVESSWKMAQQSPAQEHLETHFIGDLPLKGTLWAMGTKHLGFYFSPLVLPESSKKKRERGS